MLRTVPLSVQLVLTFVGLIIGTTAVLTTAAYTYSRVALEDEARRTLLLATQTREEALTQLFSSRQQRAEGLLASMQSLCGEPLGAGRIAWAPDCVQTLVSDFRNSERASGVLLTYRNRRISRAGTLVPAGPVDSGSLARIARRPEGGGTEYVMTAMQDDASLLLLFGHDEVADLFRDAPRGEMFLVDAEGLLLTAPRRGAAPTLPADAAQALVENCASGPMELVATDYRGIVALQTYRPIAAIGGACVVARVDYADVVAPAERLRAELVARGAWFVLLGAVLSLVAAQWIAAPVRRLVMSARQLQTGRFDRPIPIAGPSEVRALGRAFNVMGNDLAELVAKEQAARRDAEAANRAKDEFLATVSHELRTPLSAIMGWSHMLRAGQLPPERVRHGLEVIERNARAQKQLIEDLLDVSRIVSNRLRITREPVRLAEMIEAALDAVRPQAAAKGIAIETSLSEATVLGDAQRLQQVIWNLAWNAVKFTQPGGRVRVQMTTSTREATIAVSDTGVGISKAFLPYVFEWFRQGDAASKAQPGLGLGLGIVRHLVQLHGGRVGAESAGEGQGATFLVTLPLHTPAVPHAEASRAGAAVESPRPTLDGVRVLVVEDDDDTRELLRLTLEGAAASVTTVTSADQARSEIFHVAPDVVVSDIRMPEEDGYALIKSIRAAGLETPAIALTAYARREDAHEALAAGFQLHLPKPVDATRLIDAVLALARGQ